MDQNVLTLLQEMKPFQLLSPEKLEEIIEHSLIKEYKKNKRIIHQGARINYIFVMMEGIATNVIINDIFEEITIKTYQKNDVFGLIHAMSGGGFMYSIRAISDVKCLLIPVELFEKTMNSDVMFAEQVARLITVRLRELYQKIGTETSLPMQKSNLSQNRKKIVELMNYPVITIDKHSSIVTAAETLLKNRISSLIVVENQKPIGIITKKDLLRIFTEGIKKQSISPETITTEQAMTPNVITIESQAYYYEAIYLMVKHNIKHLPVVENKKVIGMITTRNLFEPFSDSALYLVKDIDQKKSIEELKTSIDKEENLLKVMLEEHATSKEICSVISEVNDRVTQKVIHIAEEEMLREGYGPPPVAYCWVSFGSEGRKEQTLKTDQDNGIIFADVPLEQYQQVDQYFNRFAEKVINGLVECGFPKCRGNVMATNPEWRNTINGWKELVESWINGNESELIRKFTIFIDYRGIYGDKSLADELRNSMIKDIKKKAFFLHLLVEDGIATNIAINRFGRFQLENGYLDLKYGGIIHIINGLRTLAIKHGILEVNSWDRIEALYQKKILNDDERDQILLALEDLMLLRLQTNLDKLQKGKEPDHFINPSTISKKDRIRLKRALMTTRWFQSMVIRNTAIMGSFLWS